MNVWGILGVILKKKPAERIVDENLSWFGHVHLNKKKRLAKASHKAKGREREREREWLGELKNCTRQLPEGVGLKEILAVSFG